MFTSAQLHGAKLLKVSLRPVSTKYKSCHNCTKYTTKVQPAIVRLGNCLTLASVIMILKKLITVPFLLTLLVGCAGNEVVTRKCTGSIVETLGGYTVSDFVFDNDGYAWLECKDAPYLYKTDGYNLIRYNHDNDDEGSPASSKINDVISDKDGIVWIATQKGVDRYNPELGCFDHLKLADDNSYVISIARSQSGRTCIVTRRNILEWDDEAGIFVSKIEMPFLDAKSEPGIFFDNENKLWVQYRGRLDCLDSFYNVICSIALGSDASDAVFDEMSSIWYPDENGIAVLDTRSFSVKRACDIYPEIRNAGNGKVVSVGKGFIVISCGQKSVCVNNGLREAFIGESADELTDAILKYAAGGGDAMSIAPDGSLWTASGPRGFSCYTYGHSVDTAYESLLLQLKDKNILGCVQDNDHFWFLDTSNLYCYNIHTKKMAGSVELSGFFTENNPYALSLGSDGQVLVSGAPRGSGQGLLVRVTKDADIRTSRALSKSVEGIYAFGRNDDVVVAGAGSKIYVYGKNSPDNCRGSLDVFNDDACYASFIQTLDDKTVLVCFTDHNPVIYDSSNDKVRLLKADNINQAYFSSCTQDARGNIWIGSTDNGLFVCPNGTDTLVRVTAFPDILVRHLASDNEGNVFAMDFSGNVYLFDESMSGFRKVWSDSSDYPAEHYLVRLPDYSVAMVGSSIYYKSGKDKLKPESKLEKDAHVVITSGKKILSTFRTSEYPSRNAVLRLPRDTKDLNLHIGLISGRDSYANYSYTYDINGLKTGPRESFDNSFPLYGASRPRNTIKFVICNNNLEQRTEPFTIRIRMNLLWYEIVTPLLLFGLLAASIVMALISLRKKREAGEERIKREMTEKLNMDNIDFFANISHEFRTPLTLINGAVSVIDSDSDGESGKSIAVIKRNTNRMLKLVSQMLDFNKLDHGMLKLNVKLESVSEIIEDTKSSFDIGAKLKSIHLSVNMPSNKIIGWIDRDKMEKILYNLCSNAVKYTPEGGYVTIEAAVDADNRLNVSVSDTGIGIDNEDLDVVFDRFYQVESTRKSGGTGIGLYYTKSLVTLHHGEISVRQRKDDAGNVVGSVFSFSVPLSENEYSESEKNLSADNYTSIDSKEYLSEYVKTDSNVGEAENKPKLMIIDDDYEMVYYLKSIFSSSYNVYFRFDALSGYKMIEEIHPDIVVCDIMMVDVDGVELCRMVKNNISLCHIPVIMLTAKSTVQDQIQSLGVGADAYVIKPFNPDYLKALVRTTIENRNRVRRMLTSSTSVPAESEKELCGRDRQFMEKLYAEMRKELQEGELDIDTMASLMNVSRTKFYYKVKALTGQTPNDFFCTYKLNYSLEYIKERKYKISAIAEMLGFSSPSHFSSLFKKKFGVLPSQYYEDNDNPQ